MRAIRRWQILTIILVKSTAMLYPHLARLIQYLSWMTVSVYLKTSLKVRYSIRPLRIWWIDPTLWRLCAQISLAISRVVIRARRVSILSVSILNSLLQLTKLLSRKSSVAQFRTHTVRPQLRINSAVGLKLNVIRHQSRYLAHWTYPASPWSRRQLEVLTPSPQETRIFIRLSQRTILRTHLSKSTNQASS